MCTTGGQCTGPHMSCVNTAGSSFECVCDEGWTGDECDSRLIKYHMKQIPLVYLSSCQIFIS